MDRADTIANGVIGGLFGILVSAPLVIELAFSVLINERGTLWWTAYFEISIVVLFGTLGLIFGDRFINWMSENWHHFYRHRGG